jgi:hypothetical protein
MLKVGNIMDGKCVGEKLAPEFTALLFDRSFRRLWLKTCQFNCLLKLHGTVRCSLLFGDTS